MSETEYLKLRDKVVKKLEKFRKNHGNMSSLARDLDLDPKYIARVAAGIIQRPGEDQLLLIDGAL